LDIKKFNDDSKLDATKEKVQSDYVSGLNASVDGTPTFYLNGIKISFGSAAELEKLLRAELE
jgi:protein-disulfide isomerase